MSFLLALNSLFHLIQLPIYGANKMTVGTFIWGCALAVLALCWSQNMLSSAVLYLTLLLPLTGGLGLLIQGKASSISAIINGSILWLDAAIITAATLILLD